MLGASVRGAIIRDVEGKIVKKKSPRKSPRAFADWTGLEPATPCVTGMYSNQLNYQT